MERNTYIRDEEGLKKARKALREIAERERAHPPGPDAYAWQDRLPELPEDGETEVLISDESKARSNLEAQ
jgi:hypothetical protein